MFIFQQSVQMGGKKTRTIDRVIVDQNAHKINMKQVLVKPKAATKKELENEKAVVRSFLKDIDYLNNKQKDELVKFYSMSRTQKDMLQTPENAVAKVKMFVYRAETDWHRMTKMVSPIEHYDFNAKEMAGLLKLSIAAEANDYYRERMWLFDSKHCQGKWDPESQPVPKQGPHSKMVYLLASLNAALTGQGGGEPDEFSRLKNMADNSFGAQADALFNKIRGKRAQNHLYE